MQLNYHAYNPSTEATLAQKSAKLGKPIEAAEHAKLQASSQVEDSPENNFQPVATGGSQDDFSTERFPEDPN